MLPKDIAKLVPRQKLMAEGEWRRLGVQQSQGWVHYMVHNPGKRLRTLIMYRLTCTHQRDECLTN